MVATTGAALLVAATRASKVRTSSSPLCKAHANSFQVRVATAKAAVTAASRAVASGRDPQYLPPTCPIGLWMIWVALIFDIPDDLLTSLQR